MWDLVRITRRDDQHYEEYLEKATMIGESRKALLRVILKRSLSFVSCFILWSAVSIPKKGRA